MLFVYFFSSLLQKMWKAICQPLTHENEEDCLERDLKEVDPLPIL